LSVAGVLTVDGHNYLGKRLLTFYIRNIHVVVPIGGLRYNNYISDNNIDELNIFNYKNLSSYISRRTFRLLAVTYSYVESVGINIGFDYGHTR